MLSRRFFSIARSIVTALATLDEAALTAGPAAVDGAWHEQARGLISDLMRRSPAVYWADLLLSAGLAWGLTVVYFTAPAWSVQQIGAFLATSVLFFRAGTFIHEIVHMPSGQMPWFKRAWNLLVGMPFLMPWMLYRNHVEHHNHTHFGAPSDGDAGACGRQRGAVRLLLITTLLHRSGLLDPYAARGAGELRVTSVARSAPRFWRSLPRLVTGRYSAFMNVDEGYLSDRCERLEITGLAGYTLDGEEFDADAARPLVITAGPRPRFLTP